MVAEPIPFEELEKLFGSIAFFYEQLLLRIAESIESVFLDVAENIDEIFNRLFDRIVAMFEVITERINQLFDALIGSIKDLVDEATTYVKGLLKEISALVQALVTEASELFTKLYDTVFEGITGIVDEVSLIFSDIFDVVKTNIERITIEVTTQLKGLFGVVREGVEQVLGSVNEIIISIQQGVAEFIAVVINGVGGALRALLDTISDLPGEIADLANRIIESSRENIGSPISSLPINLITELVERISGEPLADSDKMQLSLMNMVFGTSPVERSPQAMREVFNEFMPAHPVMKAIITALVAPLMLVQVYGGVAQANSQIILQEHALENPYRLMQPSDLVRSKHFDLLSKEDTATDLQKHGYTESDAEIMLQIGETIAPEAEQVIWWLRGIISEAEFESALLAHGWSFNSIEHLKESAFFIPPVQDLITMAVREVFTPAVAERFGQFEDFPPEFVEQAAKVGLSQEWALNYWGAHWALPSVQMGFEMLHRRVIGEEDLNLLLKSADVMPFWRDKLIAISFNPLTRVDIRRMHKMDVLTDEEVLDAYRDIGYNELNAQRLLEFTIALNEPARAQDDADLSELTRTNIINFYTDGLLPRQEAFALLENLGLSIDAADLFLDAADLDEERKDRRAQTEIILDRADSGTITFEQAQDELGRLGLETQEIQNAVLDLRKREAKRTQLPSRADLDKMLKKGIITPIEYVDIVQRLGFSELWAKRYLQLIQG